MKNIRLLIIASFVFIASCIPSLHPIYTNDTVLIDDRIIGTWITEKAGLTKKDLEPYKSGPDVKLNIKKLEFKDGDLFQFSTLDLWQFDRAANIRYDKINKDGSTSNTAQFDHPLSEIDSALILDGYKITEIEKLNYYILQYQDLKDNEGKLEKMMVHLTEINDDIYMDFEPVEGSQEANRFSINHIPAHTFAKLKIEDEKLILKSFDSEFIEELIKNKRVRLKHERINDAIVLTASSIELREFIKKYGKDDNLYAEDEVLSQL